MFGSLLPLRKEMGIPPKGINLGGGGGWKIARVSPGTMATLYIEQKPSGHYWPQVRKGRTAFFQINLLHVGKQHIWEEVRPALLSLTR